MPPHSAGDAGGRQPGCPPVSPGFAGYEVRREERPGATCLSACRTDELILGNSSASWHPCASAWDPDRSASERR